MEGSGKGVKGTRMAQASSVLGTAKDCLLRLWWAAVLVPHQLHVVACHWVLFG